MSELLVPGAGREVWLETVDLIMAALSHKSIVPGVVHEVPGSTEGSPFAQTGALAWDAERMQRFRKGPELLTVITALIRLCAKEIDRHATVNRSKAPESTKIDIYFA